MEVIEKMDASNEEVLVKTVGESPMQLVDKTPSIPGSPSRSKKSHPVAHALKEAIRGKGIVPDLVLHLSDGKVQCHRLVLAAVSEFASDIFAEFSDSTDVLLPEFTEAEVRLFLNLIYTGKTVIPDDEESLRSLESLAICFKLETFSVTKESLPPQRTNKEQDSSSFEDNFDLLKESLLTIGLLSNNNQTVENVVQPAKDYALLEVPTNFPPTQMESSVSPAQSEPSSISGGAGSDWSDLSSQSMPESPPTAETGYVIPKKRFPKTNMDLIRTVNQLPTDQAPKWEDNFKKSEEFIYKICYICDQVFLGLHPLLRHLRAAHSHNSHQSIKCHICFSVQVSGVALHDHMRLHFKSEITEDGREINVCFQPGCDEKEFATRAALMRHRFTKHPKKNMKKEKHKCEDCGGKLFSSVKSYAAHMMSKHNKRPFVCEYCSQRFTLLSCLDNHVQAKHNPQGLARVHKCDLCEKTFKTRAVLMNHRREQHELSDDARKVKCHICGFKASGVRNLGKHLKCHEETRSFQCHVCSKMFRHMSNLTVHVKSHKDQPPYECVLCLTSFKRPHHLKSHFNSASHKHAVEEEAREAAERAKMTPIDISEQNAAVVSITLENNFVDQSNFVISDGHNEQPMLVSFDTLTQSLNQMQQ